MPCSRGDLAWPARLLCSSGLPSLTSPPSRHTITPVRQLGRAANQLTLERGESKKAKRIQTIGAYRPKAKQGSNAPTLTRARARTASAATWITPGSFRSPSQPFCSPSQPFRSPSQPFRSPSQPFRSPSQPFRSPSQPFCSPSRPFCRRRNHSAVRRNRSAVRRNHSAARRNRSAARRNRSAGCRDRSVVCRNHPETAKLKGESKMRTFRSNIDEFFNWVQVALDNVQSTPEIATALVTFGSIAEARPHCFEHPQVR